MNVNRDVAAGQAVYTPFTLAAYDWFVLGFSNRLLWRCPTSNLRDLYARNVGATHVDIGVGTGYFLDKTPWPVPDPRITLVDLNPHSLEAAAKRIARYKPETVTANCLEPLPVEGPFDSVGLCYLLHCLPGGIAEKAIVFDRVAPVLAENGVIFGATILQGDTPRSLPARALMKLYNRKGVFSNAADTFQDLRQALENRFADVALRRFGAVVLFEARRPL
ncbi:class I SAM-dependent methyltransferase [Oricola nitratireducens]|uniref:class I SAM-dependent methyltransferase n=1 Tax=Oricola nitratireducens TaxID=2775868 RepID=UPI001869397D|nr:class I SAM-dependent methyltransferase [Oricola nitratireducens]